LSEDKKRAKKDILKLVNSKKGILLDMSWGGQQQPNSLRLGPGGEIDAIPTAMPIPLPTGCVHTAILTHILEFLEPENFFPWLDELHRVMRPQGVVYISGPYGGDESRGWLSDPTHRLRVTEETFTWLDPATPIYNQHESVGRKQPKPWKMLTQARVPGPHGTISINITMQAWEVGKQPTRISA
jgi:hypothetical protein